jgi:hypothetical protein
MNTCFLCGNVMVPCVPVACNNTSLRSAFEAVQSAMNRNQPPRVADYTIRLFQAQKICLLEERYNHEKPTVSLTNSIETAIVQVCSQYGLCPAVWTFVEHANMGEEMKSYHEYDMVAFTGGDIDWKYVWHSDYKAETEPYSDALLVRRVEQYRGGLTGSCNSRSKQRHFILFCHFFYNSKPL